MPVTNYDTIDGRMIGYHVGGVQKDFLSDALGSVTAEVDQTGNTKTFDGRYKPYGGDLSSTGTRGKYGWVGSWGYRETGLEASSHYVRARSVSKTSGTWTSIDSLWPNQKPYGYCKQSPINNSDPSGMFVIGSSCKTCKCKQGIINAITNACSPTIGINSLSSKEWAKVLECLNRKKGNCGIPTWMNSNSLASCMKNNCNSNKTIVCEDCRGGANDSTAYYSGCQEGNNSSQISDIHVCINKCKPNGDPPDSCGGYTGGCNAAKGRGPSCSMIHEIAHSCGFCSKGTDDPRGRGCQESMPDHIACCITEVIVSRNG